MRDWLGIDLGLPKTIFEAVDDKNTALSKEMEWASAHRIAAEVTCSLHLCQRNTEKEEEEEEEEEEKYKGVQRKNRQ